MEESKVLTRELLGNLVVLGVAEAKDEVAQRQLLALVLVGKVHVVQVVVEFWILTVTECLLQHAWVVASDLEAEEVREENGVMAQDIREALLEDIRGAGSQVASKHILHHLVPRFLTLIGRDDTRKVRSLRAL